MILLYINFSFCFSQYKKIYSSSPLPFSAVAYDFFDVVSLEEVVCLPICLLYTGHSGALG